MQAACMLASYVVEGKMTLASSLHVNGNIHLASSLYVNGNIHLASRLSDTFIYTIAIYPDISPTNTYINLIWYIIIVFCAVALYTLSLCSTFQDVLICEWLIALKLLLSTPKQVMFSLKVTKFVPY